MKKIASFLGIVFALTAFAGTQTSKEYVDKKDAEVLERAKTFTEEHVIDFEDWTRSEIGKIEEIADQAKTNANLALEKASRESTAFRGQFSNYDSLPSSDSGYLPDKSNSRTPRANDLITVDDWELSNDFDTTLSKTSIKTGSWTICAGNGWAVAFNGSSVMRSSDGIEWSASQTSRTFKDITYGNGTMFIAYTSGGDVYNSTDNGNSFSKFITIPNFGGMYVVASDTSILAIGTDGGTYSYNVAYAISTAGDMVMASGLPSNGYFAKPSAVGSVFYIPDNSLNKLYKSNSGTARLFSTINNVNYPQEIIGNGNNLICHMGAKLVYSDNGGSVWANSNVSDFKSYGETACYAYGGGTYIASSKGRLMFSPDGHSWTVHDIGVTFESVAYHNGTFLFSNNDGIWRLNRKHSSAILRYVGNWETDGKNGWKFASTIVDSTARSALSTVYTKSQIDEIVGGLVPETRKVNGQPLTQDITIEGMTDNATVLTNGSLKTKSGTAITAENVGAANNEQVQQLQAVVTTYTAFVDGSNVVFSITNYLSGAYVLNEAKFKVLELKEGGYQEVYNSRTEILLHVTNETQKIVGFVNAATNALAGTISGKADKAWGKYTSAGGEAPSNTVYMTAPNTVFAGGMEYERVAVGEGAICVLTTKGAPVYTQGDEGTFKFQDDGGTNYFGFAKSDSYTQGCRTDGITVQNQMVTLHYDITMSGVPCIWYKEDLTSSEPWEQLNLPDRSAVPGATHQVQWEENPDPGTQECHINVNGEPKGFFKATVEVAGSAKFMSNMPADLSGGIFCTDGQHKVGIDWNNGNPRLVEVQ